MTKEKYDIVILGGGIADILLQSARVNLENLLL